MCIRDRHWRLTVVFWKPFLTTLDESRVDRSQMFTGLKWHDLSVLRGQGGPLSRWLLVSLLVSQLSPLHAHLSQYVAEGYTLRPQGIASSHPLHYNRGPSRNPTTSSGASTLPGQSMSWRPLAALRGGEWGGVVGFKAIVAYNFLKVVPS
eukprot:911375-Rhodomonas_salina.2